MPTIIKLGRPRRFVVSNLLRHFQFAAVLQIRRNAGSAEGMIANPRFDAGRFRAPANDAVGVLLEEGIGGKLTGLAASGASAVFLLTPVDTKAQNVNTEQRNSVAGLAGAIRDSGVKSAPGNISKGGSDIIRHDGLHESGW